MYTLTILKYQEKLANIPGNDMEPILVKSKYYLLETE